MSRQTLLLHCLSPPGQAPPGMALVWRVVASAPPKDHSAMTRMSRMPREPPKDPRQNGEFAIIAATITYGSDLTPQPVTTIASHRSIVFCVSTPISTTDACLLYLSTHFDSLARA